MSEMPAAKTAQRQCGVAGCERAADRYVTVEGSFGCLDRFVIDVCQQHVRALDLVAADVEESKS